MPHTDAAIEIECVREELENKGYIDDHAYLLNYIDIPSASLV